MFLISNFLVLRRPVESALAAAVAVVDQAPMGIPTESARVETALTRGPCTSYSPNPTTTVERIALSWIRRIQKYVGTPSSTKV